MNTTPTSIRRRTIPGRIRAATAIAAALAMGGVISAPHASAESDVPACIAGFFGGNPGAEISSFAGPFFRDYNPGAGWHENGDPLVPGRCNPNWTD